MTKSEINARLEYIRSISHDPEAAHVAEDDLRQQFIAFVASRNFNVGELPELAVLVASSADIAFVRWFA